MQQRNAATTKGLMRRVKDLQFEKVKDPRQNAKVDYPLATMLTALVTSMVTKAQSLRDVEQRTNQIGTRHGEWIGVSGRIADNTFGKLIPRLQPSELVGALHAMAKAEHRRGNLAPITQPFGIAAIDGKNVATLHWYDLCRVLELPEDSSYAQVKKLLREQHPQMQACNPKDGKPYALARVHTVTLISSKAAYGIHQRPIEGCTNEIGAMPDLLAQVHKAYGRTGMIQMMTTDAGNTSLGTATLMVEQYGWDYFSQFKLEQGELHREARRVLDPRSEAEADATYGDSQNGMSVSYYLWQYDLGEDGWLNWSHARQVLRVRRVCEHSTTGRKTVGDRYYVCSKGVSELKSSDALAISRGHWRCEEETHWTADVVLNEDRRRLAWSRHPNGVFVIAVIRMIATAILAVARKLSRFGASKQTPTWHQVAEHFLLALCASTLRTEAFDDI
jgi:predicted transposase YbfD/YdcC